MTTFVFNDPKKKSLHLQYMVQLHAICLLIYTERVVNSMAFEGSPQPSGPLYAADQSSFSAVGTTHYQVLLFYFIFRFISCRIVVWLPSTYSL